MDHASPMPSSQDLPAAQLEQLAAAQLRAGDARAAAESYERCIALCPENPGLHNNLGAALLRAGRLTEAIANFRIAADLSPTYVRPLVNLGMALRQNGRTAEAIEHLRRALRLSPDYAPALVNLGDALLEVGDYQESLDSLERACRLQPTMVEACVSLAAALTRTGDTAQAIDVLRRALTLAPQDGEAHVALGYLLYATGNWPAAWPHMEYRFATRVRPAHIKAPPGVERWDGTLTCGLELWLIAEQGLGDTLQFVRYARALADHGMRVVLACDPALVSLLQTVDVRVRIVPLSAAPDDPSARWYPLMSLPLVFKTSLETVPCPTPYLASEPIRVARWQRLLGPYSTLRVGLAWAGNPAHANDRNRSVRFADLVRQLPPGIQYVSLQKEVRAEDRPSLLSNPHILNIADDLHDFRDTAALCECLDLILTVDTSVAHLSGALARRTWILLPFAPDWRWLFGRADSPWYPTVKLYRQGAAGDWDSVLAQVGGDLRKLGSGG